MMDALAKVTFTLAAIAVGFTVLPRVKPEIDQPAETVPPVQIVAVAPAADKDQQALRDVRKQLVEASERAARIEKLLDERADE